MSIVERSPESTGVTTRSQLRDRTEKFVLPEPANAFARAHLDSRDGAGSLVHDARDRDSVGSAVDSGAGAVRFGTRIESKMDEIMRQIELIDRRTREAENVVEDVVEHINRSRSCLHQSGGANRDASSSDGAENTVPRDATCDRENSDTNRLGNLRLPRGGWLKDPFDDLTYSGRTDKTNPMKFLRHFQRIARYENIREQDQLHYFGKCLRGAASNWFDVRDPVDITEAIVTFKNYFWSDEQQSKLREKLYVGKYSRVESRLTMSEYALDLSRQARNLQPPLSDKEIIRCLRRHYGTGVTREIRPSTVSNIEDFIGLLDEIDDDLKRDREERIRKSVVVAGQGRVGDASFSNRGQDRIRRVSFPFGDRRSDKFESARAVEYHPNKFDSGSGGGRAQTSVRITELPSERVASSSIRDNARRANEVKEDARSYLPRANRKFAMMDRGEEEIEEPVTDGEVEAVERDEVDAESTEIAEEIAENNFQLNIIRTKELLRDVDDVSREDQETASRKRRPYAIAKFGKTCVKCLIDTGAQISAVTKSLFDRLTRLGVDMRVLPIRKFNLVGAFSEKGEPIAKKIFVDFSIGEKNFSYGLYIVKNLSYEMVLGLDFLSQNNATLHCSENKFRVNFAENSVKVESVSVNCISLEEPRGGLNRLLSKFEDMFGNGIGCVRNYQHEIRVTSNAPYKSKSYPIPEIHRDRVRKHLLELEETGIVERSATQYINPIVVVVKKCGEIRLCLDARELNKRMENDHEQPPTIDEIFRRVGSRKYFSTLDVAKAFWQIELRKCDRKYTGFKFDNQSFVFKRLPFGLKTAGSSFMRAITKALGEDCRDFSIVYLDDILIASDSYEQHIEHLRLILSRLNNAGFKLNRGKCEFMKPEISFLGHTFDQVKVEMNADTKLAIENFARPRNRKAIQSFLGLVNWDRRFIGNLANLTKPLENLLRKDVKFVWDDVQQKSFSAIKQAFRDADKLFIIRPECKFGIYIDASKNGLGARLFQYNEVKPDVKYTVAYASRSLRGAEVNYTITELECLSLVWALRKWCVMLLGRHILVHTDHRALKFLSSCADDSSRIARWLAFLREFDLEIVHIPGKENVIADVLSRNNVGDEFVRKREASRRIAAIRCPDDANDTREWVEFVIEGQKSDPSMRALMENEPDRYILRDDMIRVKRDNEDRILIPEKITWEFLKKIHIYLLHFGTDKVIDFANRFFVIANLERIARDVTASCCECMATKYYTRPTRGVEYYELPDAPSKAISLDIFGPLPQTPRGNKYILVLMDQFSKLVRLCPMKNQKLETVMRTLDTRYFNNVRKPLVILTDNAGQFITERWSEYLADKDIECRKTSPYNPQSNPVERVMRELGRVIRLYAHDRQTTWDRIVERTERTINSTEHRSTGLYPYVLHPELRDCEIYIDARLRSTLRDQDDREEQFQQLVQRAARTLQRRAQQRRAQAQKHRDAERYAEGASVWIKLHRRSDASRRLTKKIHLVYEGPYMIVREIRRNAYLIADFENNIVGTFNSRQLRPHRESRFQRERVRIDVLSVDIPRKNCAGVRDENRELFIVHDSTRVADKKSKENIRVGSTDTTRVKNATEVKVATDKNNYRRNVAGVICVPDESNYSRIECADRDRWCNVAAYDESFVRPDLRKRENVMTSYSQEFKSSSWKIPETGETLPITEKAWRHLGRLFKVIAKRIPVVSVEGSINDVPIEVLFDKRGDFDAVTSTALHRMKMKNPNIKVIDKPDHMPAYFKQQRRIMFRAVECKVKINGYTIGMRPSIIPNPKPVIILGRHSTEKMFMEIARGHGMEYTRRTMLAKGQELVQAWAKADKTIGREVNIDSYIYPSRQHPKKKNEETAQNDSDSDTPVGKRRRITRSEVRELWSSDDEETQICEEHQSVMDFVPQKLERTISRSISMSDINRPTSENKENIDIVPKNAKGDLPEVKKITVSQPVNSARRPVKRHEEISGAVSKDTSKNDRQMRDKIVRESDASEINVCKNKTYDILSVTIGDSGRVSPTDKETDRVRVDNVEVKCARGARDVARSAYVVASSGAQARDDNRGEKIPESETSRSCVADLLLAECDTIEELRDSLRSIVVARGDISAERANTDSMSGESLNSLSTDEILRRSQEIRERIAESLRAVEERRRAIDNYKMLILAERRVSSGLSTQLCRRESEVPRVDETMAVVRESFSKSTAARVITDEVNLVDGEKNSLYHFSMVAAVTNKQRPNEDRPIQISYVLKEGRVIRSYAAYVEETREDVERGDADREAIRRNEALGGEPISSTPMVRLIGKPRVKSVVEVKFADDSTLPSQILVDEESDEIVPFPSPGCRREFESCFSDMFGVAADEDELVPIYDVVREVVIGEGQPECEMTTDATASPAKRRALSKGASRSSSPSRESPLAGEMQPVAAEGPSGRERPPTPGAEMQPRVRIERGGALYRKQNKRAGHARVSQ